MNNMTDDYYNFIEDQRMLVGERTAKQYRLGDKVKVTVLDVDKMEKRVDFSVISTTKIKRKKLTPQEDHRSHFHKKKRYGNEKKYGHNSRERKNKKYNKKRRR